MQTTGRLWMLRNSWDQGFSVSRTTVAATKPIPRHDWPSNRCVPFVLHFSCVFHSHLSDVRHLIFSQVKSGTTGSEAATGELHMRRQERNQQRALASCTFCQLIPAVATSQQQTFPPLQFFAHRKPFGARRKLLFETPTHLSAHLLRCNAA